MTHPTHRVQRNAGVFPDCSVLEHPYCAPFRVRGCPVCVPGWYPDPGGSGQQRYFDGGIASPPGRGWYGGPDS